MTDVMLSPLLLDLLRCPCPAHATLTTDSANQELVCDKCQAAFPIRDGIPVMLLDEAKRPGDEGRRP
jgi:uncharacterized protein YbaR (Trm112 family)